MTVKLVQTHAITPEDQQFFSALAQRVEPFWASAKTLGQTEADFDSQQLPDEDRFAAHTGFRILSRLPSVATALEDFVAEKGFQANRNSLVYNPMSFMAWHTNSNVPGLRHYFTYTTGRAIFRWRHPKTGEIFDEIDGEGWTYRTFVISPNQPVWHTIWTEKVRLSFGFNSPYAASRTGSHGF
jgi:hypothetical protein